MTAIRRVTALFIAIRERGFVLRRIRRSPTTFLRRRTSGRRPEVMAGREPWHPDRPSVRLS
ncbi:hypothetical protein [Nocardia sp. NPDC024068]|uniref:hypothetical protein n=1 Tax=Nocardia sp. NPDC024068 TaxID=3157197 RepID=UPI0033DB1169